VAPDSNEIIGPDGAVKLDHKVMQLLAYSPEMLAKICRRKKF
jgi:hypothetical protein